MSETDPRFLKFDAQAVDTLQALGFKIEGEMALIRGDMIVSVVRHPDQPDLFALTITVPKGKTFTAFTRCKDLLAAYRIRETCGLHRRERAKP
jgi:hypothetical protein